MKEVWWEGEVFYYMLHLKMLKKLLPTFTNFHHLNFYKIFNEK